MLSQLLISYTHVIKHRKDTYSGAKRNGLGHLREATPKLALKSAPTFIIGNVRLKLLALSGSVYGDGITTSAASSSHTSPISPLIKTHTPLEHHTGTWKVTRCSNGDTTGRILLQNTQDGCKQGQEVLFSVQ